MLEETGWNLLNVADSPMTSDACRAREVSMGRTLPGLHGAVVQTGVYAAILQPASRGRQALLGVTSPTSALASAPNQHQIMGRGPDDLIGRLGLP